MTGGEYVCIGCGHGPHTAKPCSVPNCECKFYQRADLQGYRAMIATNNAIVQGFQLTIPALVDIVDMLCEAFPEAAERLAKKREDAQKLKEQKEENGTTTGSDSAAKELPAGSGTGDLPAASTEPASAESSAPEGI